MAHNPSPAAPAVYERPAIALHWLIALLIAGAFALGWVMTDIPGFTPAKLRYYSWHKWIGVTVFALAIVRVLWRATHRAPPLPPGMPAAQQWGAHAVHGLLYALMLALPAVGYLASSAANFPVVYLGIVPLPRLIAPDPALKEILESAHSFLAWVLLTLVAVHVLAVVKHQFFDRDGLLSRMLPFHKSFHKSSGRQS